MPQDSQNNDASVSFLDLPTFLRKYEQRSLGMMWLLGAGASRATGIKTAGDMIWDFKSRLYRSDRKVPASAVSDLGDTRVRAELQRFFDANSENPPLNSPEEYSFYFEKTYPNAKDRRIYIDDMMRGAKPSFGHMALAHLMKKDLCRIVWTTNFDRVFEDAVTSVFETSSILTVGDLGEPKRIQTAFSESRWPIYAKLHGDFQSEDLKNTKSELANQDVEMRRVFLDTCRHQGLAVSGYSGRDKSVMEVLNRALEESASFPNGLFWFVREEDQIFEEVAALIATAKEKGVDADFVKAESFDELFSDVVRYLPQTEQLSITLDDKRKLAPRKIDLSNAAPSIPFIRTNAIPIVEYPNTCRLIECDIGGAKEIQEAMGDDAEQIVAARIKKGVLAFGDDGELKRIFKHYGIKKLDTHSILPERLKFESGERSLLRDALFSAISASCGFPIIQDRHRHYIRADIGDARFDLQTLTRAAGRLHGERSGGNVKWAEACGLRLDYRLGALWLLLKPFVMVDLHDDLADEAKDDAKEFVRERRATRYNSQSNALLDGWVQALFGAGQSGVDLGFDGGTGIGARFEILPVTGFSGLTK
ncbi:SIR2 family NAD-dependent protein deacylase [Hyphococcus sp.]|jgi:NAD-dependent SIR2 family protein deacetylase|uniref:SIR2 family NAD-dependent protein deacylase n=1 Tax=Hyphococcus sp. TaxID=2038636 RepID=UPI003D0D206C